MRLHVFLLALCLWFVPSLAQAANPAAPAVAAADDEDGKAKPATEVTVGVYLNQMPYMSLRENKYTMDMYVWFRWKGDAKPYNSFEVVGGKVESKQQTSLETKNGVNYACYRVVVTIASFWDVHDFPYDNHVLKILIEDGDADLSALHYIPDTQNSAVSPSVVAPGWTVASSKAKASVKDFVYNTNYGDLSRPPASPITYSRFEYDLPLERHGMAHVFKLFFALYIAVGISLLSLFIAPADIGPRVSLAVGAVFASVGASYIISANLPPSSAFTRAEWINLVSVAFLLLSLIVTVTSLRIFRAGDKERSTRFDRIGFRALLVSYTVINVLILAVR